MPIRPEEKARYPKDWKAISDRIRFERAGGECEWPKCRAPHGQLIFRDKRNPEEWRWPDSADLGETDPDSRGVTVVLTVAHLNAEGGPCNCRETTGRYCGIDEHLAAYCQLHHLRYDAPRHVREAAATRRRKKANLELFADLQPEASCQQS